MDQKLCSQRDIQSQFSQSKRFPANCPAVNTENKLWHQNNLV